MRLLVVLLLGLVPLGALAHVNRKLYADEQKCLNPPEDALEVPGADTLITMQGSGEITFLCATGEVEFPGDNRGTLKDPTGEWSGEFYYDFTTGTPVYSLRRNDGYQRILTTYKEAQVRQSSPEGAEVDWTRREVITDTGLYMNYIVRRDTNSGEKPSPGDCDDKIKVPWNATFLFQSCGEDQELKEIPSPPPPPAPPLQPPPVALPPSRAPSPAPPLIIIAPSPPLIIPPRAAPPPPTPVPIPAPAPAPPVVIIAPVEEVPTPAPVAPSNGSVVEGISKSVLIAMIGMVVMMMMM